MKTKPRSKNWLLIKFREYHTWLGLACALFVITTGLTGIALNHKELFFDEKKHEEKNAKATFTTNTEIAKLPISFEIALSKASDLLGANAPLEQIQLKNEHGKLTYKIKASEAEIGIEREILVDPITGKVTFMDGYSMMQNANHREADSSVNWKKFINDLHTGELVGTPGKLVIDFTAITLSILTITGIYLWWIPKVRKKQALKTKQFLSP